MKSPSIKVASTENYSLDSVTYQQGADLLLVKFQEIESLHIIDNVSLSVKCIKESTASPEAAWTDFYHNDSHLILPSLSLNLSAHQLYDLIYKRKAGVTQREDKLI